jgi:imidazolonepropionase-like amidohydrolase
MERMVRMAIEIVNARVFDGNEITAGRKVVVDGGSISESTDITETVDGSGRTLLPGLIDSHVHLYENTEFLKMAARHGVTTMLDMGIRNPEAVDGLRNIPGLTSVFSSCGMIFAYGSKAVEMMKYPEYMAVKDAKDAERIVGRQVETGADYIKMILEEKGKQQGVEYPPGVGNAVTEQAHNRGKLVMAHAVSNKTYRFGWDYGVDVLMHIPYMAPIEPELVADIVSKGTVVVPTLIMGKCLMDKLLKTHPVMAKMMMFTGRLTKGGDAFNFTLDIALASLSKLHKAGARVFAGTDSNMDDPTTPSAVPYGSSLHDELEFYVRAGMSPTEAIQSATSKPAEFFGFNDRGTVTPGKRADLLLVKGDPTKNIGDIRNVERVWINGVEVLKD